MGTRVHDALGAHFHPSSRTFVGKKCHWSRAWETMGREEVETERRMLEHDSSGRFGLG